MTLLPFVVSWAVLATIVLLLAFYRRAVSRKEDDCLHVSVDTTAEQTLTAKKLVAIDRWGKILTVVVTVYGLVILGIFMYNGWIDSSRIAG